MTNKQYQHSKKLQETIEFAKELSKQPLKSFTKEGKENLIARVMFDMGHHDSDSVKNEINRINKKLTPILENLSSEDLEIIKNAIYFELI